MNKTLIPWARNPDGTQGYTYNPVTGCLNHTNGICKGGDFPCYAYKLANGRLRDRYLANKRIAVPFDVCMPERSQEEGYFYKEKRLGQAMAKAYKDPFYPRFWEDRYAELVPRIGGKNYGQKGVFLNDMSDWVGIGIPRDWTQKVITLMQLYPKYRFYTLTKQPQNLAQWSPFPDNCWVGVTATDTGMAYKAVSNLKRIEAKVKYISFEPLLGRIINWVGDAEYLFKSTSDYLGCLDWVIIGACTGTYIEMVHLSRQTRQEQDFNSIKQFRNKWTLQPKIEWVEEIVEACDKAGVKVFLKNNLNPLFAEATTIKDKWVFSKTKFGRGELYRQEMPKEVHHV